MDNTSEQKTENQERKKIVRGPRLNQKLKIMYLMKILLEETDEDHDLTLNEIVEKLKAYNVTAERKSLYSDIENLRTYGLDIIGMQYGKTYHYKVASRQFQLVELKLLVDAVQSSRFITEKKSDELIAKLESYASKYEAKKQMAEQARRTKAMLEDAMESQETYTYAEIQGMLENPVIHDLVAALVFRVMDGGGVSDHTQEEQAVFGFVTAKGMDVFANHAAYTDESEGVSAVSEDEPCNSLHHIEPSDDTLLTVAHPFQMYTQGMWHTIQKYVFDNQIIQPFKQVFRELYVKTEEELNMERSLRYAGNQIQPKKTVACLRTRHWVADIEEGLQKVYYKENIVARIYALADWFSPADIESPTLEWVVFTDRKTGKDLKLREIPDIIFSEVMRDVDLAVSVAHAGGVDPETSHSTVEMRKAIAEFTMPLFKLTNVTFTKNHAVIHGARANYTVHLGSGVVHQEAGPMINVLPVHSQRRGQIFLPFVDDDPKTSEVLTKILFFAEDKKIKDPFILEQIRQ